MTLVERLRGHNTADRAWRRWMIGMLDDCEQAADAIEKAGADKKFGDPALLSAKLLIAEARLEKAERLAEAVRALIADPNGLVGDAYYRLRVAAAEYDGQQNARTEPRG